ncbi:Xylose isomerase-like, TIM barrel domain [Phytophthora cactorum]|nr:Xylose isomerase-like, TIM barrel domain [Phytophthora cactorum]
MVQHQVKEYFPKVPKITFEGRMPRARSPIASTTRPRLSWARPWRNGAALPCATGTPSATRAPTRSAERRTRIVLWNESQEDASLSSHERLLEAAKCKADAAFEMFTKLGVKYYTFHDVDLISEGENLDESQSLLDEISDYLLDKQNQTGVFAHAAARVKKAMEITLKLGGQNFVFWGGREGFQSILNTDMKTELDHMAAFFKLVVAYKKELGATFQFLVEPKPREPMKHQYDYDAATVMAFLHTYGLQNDFKLNIEPNHTTLAGHDYEHDIYYAASYKMLGSVDCNTGDPLVGWDTDQFLMDEKKAVLVMKKIVEIGGLAPGGLNFDAKVRRESTDLEDMFIAHIGSMDCFARGLRQAAKLLEKNELGEMVKQRYASWKSTLGERIEQGKATLEEVAAYAKESGEPDHVSGKQELAELMLFRGVQ